MIHVKDHHTERLFDPWDHIGPKRRKLLDKSWSGVFRTYLLWKLPVGKIARHFDESHGRPAKELYTAMGMLILQQLHDLSDPEVTRAVAFNIDWHYALDITCNSDASMYLSERSLRRYRKILIKEGLDKLLFETLTDTLIEVFDVDTSKQRLDSTCILSNMRIMGRVGIFSSTIRRFLKKLRRSHAKLYADLPVFRFKGRYLTKDSESLFSQVKPSVTLHDLAHDLLYLVKLYRSNDSVCKLSEYRLLERVIDECCIVTDSDAGTTVNLKPPKEIPPDSLQNPSDPDAGYDSHKGSGYQAQIMETYQVKKQDDNKSPDLITYVDVEPAHKHDSHALHPAIDTTIKRDCRPEELVCDSHYGSDDKMIRAAQRRADEQTKEFKDRYRWRAGVEATNSHLKADVGMARLRVRGIASVRFAVILKALGLNILRCAKALDIHFLNVIVRLRGPISISWNRLITPYDILLSKNRYCLAMFT